MITFPGEGADSLEEETMLAAQSIDRYAGFIVLDTFEPAALYSLLTLRQNIYTDPQKPIQVSPGLYEIGRARSPDSPLLVTTNFSLTYFSVAGEVEGSGRPGLVAGRRFGGHVGADGLGGGQVRRERIAKAVNTNGMPDKLSHRKIVIPGLSRASPASWRRSCPAGRCWSVRAKLSASPRISSQSGLSAGVIVVR